MDLKNKWKDYSTVGQLLDFIEKYKIPRESKILLQRVEDLYFDKHNWEAIKKEGFHYYQAKETNIKVDSGYFNDKEQFPLLEDPQRLKMSEKDMEFLKEQYVVCWCPVKYEGDDNLYLDAHY